MANKNEKICIIGAGPAGLSAGMYLEQKGYKNYTILEKSDHVGGKCNSPTYNGKRYEMGAIMGVPGYKSVFEVMDFCGLKPDGPKLAREFKHADGSDYAMPKIAPFANIFEGIAAKQQVKKLGKILETKYKGYDKNNHLNTNPDLMVSFHEFCVKNGVEKVEKIWGAPFTSFGYGFFDEIPAAYVLQYLDMPTLISFVGLDLWTMKEGTQSIYEALDSRLVNPAKLNTNITKITRENGKVQVYVDGAAEEYDKIIVTSPLDGMLSYLGDATDDEKTCFTKIQHEHYQVFACLVDNYPDISGYCWDNMLSDKLGHAMVYYHRWENEPDQVITVYALGNHSKQEKVFTMDETRDIIKEDMKIFKVPVKEIINENEWYYFPHVSCEDYQAGWYDKVEGMQGAKNMYYAGEIMSFGDMDETIHYSKDLVDRFFD